MSAIRPGVILVAALAVLAGCGRAPVPTVASSTATTTAVALSVASAGKVEIRVAGLGGYHVAATTTQVTSLRVTLSGGPLATAVVQTVSAASLSGGHGTIVFADLPPGTVTVTIEALDAAGLVVGTKTASAPIANGSTAVVAVALQLDATHVAAAVGAIAIDVAVTDGDVVVDPVSSPSPRPSTPVLSPAPSPTPTPEPTGTVAIVGDAERSWYADGRMGVSGFVQNTWAVSKKARVKAVFYKRGAFGYKEAETLTHDFGAIDPASKTYFHLETASSVSSWSGQGTVTLTLEQY
ncbi:MAG: hypothetical protein JWM80_5407 [Cyanobacteria bacterium RYN_339]|nr:hypothetical protein [Cyanobacteria bacterium RYN_339]